MCLNSPLAADAASQKLCSKTGDMVLSEDIPGLTHYNPKRRGNSKSQAPNNKQLL